MLRNVNRSARRSGANRLVQALGIAGATLALLCAGMSAPASAAPVGTAFTYQGELVKGGAPYQGQADLIFRLHSAASGSAQVGSDVSISGLLVAAGGLITADLDFGPVFNGTALWLEVLVRTPPDGAYTTLTPRQPLTAAPFALHSLTGGASQWVNDINGIEYTAGNVGIGVQSRSDVGLYASETGNSHAAYFEGNSLSHPTVFVRNFAFDGFGLFDDASDRHFIGGRLGLGTTTPDDRTKIHAIGGTVPIWGQAYGNNLIAGYQCGVYGVGLRGTGQFPGDAVGVIGASDYSTGVAGITTNAGNGTTGQNNTSGTIGYLGGPAIGVAGHAVSPSHFGGYFTHAASNGIALRAIGLAQVNTLQILGADLAESFPVQGGTAEPGMVLALGDGADGELRLAEEPYSRRVAGVVSGANGLSAGVVLTGKSFETSGHAAVALSGRVWVKCDATRAPIHVGDLLTTAERAGHAMVATDRERAYGAILGKAMTSLEAGTGMVLVLVSLQ